MATPTLPSWPPTLTPSQLTHLSTLATDYALSHGIIYRPLPSSPSTTPALDSAIHAPFSLFPSPFPESLFTRATNLQPSFDLLYASISTNHAFLTRVIGQSVIHVDEFQKQLWHIFISVKDDLVQNLSLGLFRSDYLLHDEESDGLVGARRGELGLKQVEFNTISASFGALCTKVARLHGHLVDTTGYLGVSEGLEDKERLPENKALEILAGGLAAAHKAYLSQFYAGARGQAKKRVYVLFVVQEGERNAFDQRPLECELQKESIPVLRETFAEIAERMIAQTSSNRTLRLAHPVLGQVEISTIYFRAGYGPSDYTSSQAWETRKQLELSSAIKCPSISVQLAGAKKVQQVLAEPNELSSLLAAIPSQEAKTEMLKETFSDLYPLDDSRIGEEGYRLALQSPEGYVMKPQREGGGNNVYRSDIPPFLKELEKQGEKEGEGAIKKRAAYILMSLIKPPSGLGNYLVKAGSGAVLGKDTVSELGVYGAILFEDKGEKSPLRVLHHKSGGFLLRTKARESDEGGVAVGFSVIDSPLLI
ncbi:related to glutathione synthase [Ustilago bromivora]|uniref:Glutathione synthetase n=1 Tax=Ustilago bromivora TaxID=307758 RepID=A0A1K0GD37_9BASI|nr:related to glutathione synthase [Ustilago bromivora]SYW80571.1 related to glutathione synthase [Ustilago bromivora]